MSKVNNSENSHDSEQPKLSSPAKISEILHNNLPLIQNEIEKLRQDAKHIISRTIDISPAQVNIVKLTQEKIVIEVNLKQPDSQQEIDRSAFVDPHKQNGHNNELSNGDHSKLQSNNGFNGEPRNDSTSCSTTSNMTPNETIKGSSRRSVSESEGDSSNKPTKGILKYPKGWKKRTLSECSFDSPVVQAEGESDKNDSHSSSTFTLDQEEDEEDEEEENDQNKLKKEKKVTFNRKVFRSVFKKNSTIMNKKQRQEAAAKELKEKQEKIDEDFRQYEQLEAERKSLDIQSENNCNLNNVTTENDEAVESDDWEEVKPKKNRSRRKKTDLKNSPQGDSSVQESSPIKNLKSDHSSDFQIDIK